ncbi:MAG: FAD-dependent oxidoreductase [Magnetococcales bacterium]|nr:FAD-dependent oxidoreductase [Magnetococcales bacterium]
MVKKIILASVIVTAIILFLALDLGRYLNLSHVQAQNQAIHAFHQAHPLQTAAIYVLIYILVTGLSLPGATLTTLVGGGIFGVVQGTILVSFASTIGATLAFLASRYLFRDLLHTRFRDKLERIDQGIRKEGAFYLFTLRLVPAFPFFMINLLMGLTAMRTTTYFLVSQLGMLPGTIVYVNAGTRLAELESLHGILSFNLMASFVLLGIFPLVTKKTIDLMKRRQALSGYPRPKRFDRNLIVIGAGAAGLVSAYIAAAVRAKVTLIEKHRMGGECLNTGCVPSKALIRTAQFIHDQGQAKHLGCRTASVDFEFSSIMERVHRVIQTVAPHDSVERYTALGVECIHGTARITSPFAVEVNGQTLTTRNIIVATGRTPLIPNIPGIAEMEYLTTDTLWNIRQQPRRLLILGGGPVGCELAQAFQRLGTQVTLALRGSRLLKKEDPEISALIAKRFAREGILLLTDLTFQQFRRDNGEKCLLAQHQGTTRTIPFDQLLIAIGGKANVQGFGLEELGVQLNEDGTLQTNGVQQTSIPTIYTAGDVTGPFPYTHTAAHQAWYATVNSLFGGLKKFKTDYSVIPHATFTDPEVAAVGLNEQEATARGIAFETTVYHLDDLDRAIADEEAHGLVKVLTVPGKDKILGVTIVGRHASEIIAEYIAAMRHGLGMNKILATIHIYPTFAEANKYAAGSWKKAHQPERLLAWAARFHAWRRGGEG